MADFGMTAFQQEDGATMTQCGSPLWMAPEMIKNEAYDAKADVYSFGIVCWEMYTRQIPYRELGLQPAHLVVQVTLFTSQTHTFPLSNTYTFSLAHTFELNFL